jgi:hypothetical protein
MMEMAEENVMLEQLLASDPVPDGPRGVLESVNASGNQGHRCAVAGMSASRRGPDATARTRHQCNRAEQALCRHSFTFA